MTSFPSVHPFHMGSVASPAVRLRGTLVCIIQVQKLDTPLTQQLGLLAHECVHLLRAFMEELGEDKPSSEFEAYSVQEFFTNMCVEYFKFIGREDT